MNAGSCVVFAGIVLLMAAVPSACATAPRQQVGICSAKFADLAAAAAKDQVYSIMIKDNRITFVAFTSGWVDCVCTSPGSRTLAAMFLLPT